jgi:hypothetical protein
MSEHAQDEGAWDDADMSDNGLDDTVSFDPTPVVITDPGVPDISAPLTTDQARDLTDTIRSTSEVLYVLLSRAHRGKAWEALGYSSFADYVREEFDMSRSRAYQILDQSRVIEAIESASPDGADLPAISEAAARDLKSIIGEVVPEIEARTAGVPVSEAGQVVEEIVEDYRDKVRDKREQDALEKEEREQDEAERRGFSDTSGGGAGLYTPPPPPQFDDDEDDDDDYDPAMIRRNVQAAYDLYSSLSALKSMPDTESVINTIPVERRIQINDSLSAATGWLAEFQAAWYAQPWQDGNSDPADEDEDDDFAEDEY